MIQKNLQHLDPTRIATLHAHYLAPFRCNLQNSSSTSLPNKPAQLMQPSSQLFGLAFDWLQLIFLSSFYSYAPDLIRLESPAAYAVLWSGHAAPAAGTLLDPLNMLTGKLGLESLELVLRCYVPRTTNLKSISLLSAPPTEYSLHEQHPNQLLGASMKNKKHKELMLLKHAAQSSPATAHVQGHYKALAVAPQGSTHSPHCRLRPRMCPCPGSKS